MVQKALWGKKDHSKPNTGDYRKELYHEENQQSIQISRTRPRLGNVFFHERIRR